MTISNKKRIRMIIFLVIMFCAAFFAIAYCSIMNVSTYTVETKQVQFAKVRKVHAGQEDIAWVWGNDMITPTYLCTVGGESVYRFDPETGEMTSQDEAYED